MATESVLPGADEERLTGLLETRAVIEQAKGILMAAYRCGPDEALDMLVVASHAGGVKTHLLAANLVELARRGLAITGTGHRES